MQTEKLKDLLTKITQGELRIVTNYTGLGVEKIIEGGNQIEICVLRGYNYTGDTEEKTDKEFAANAELISLAPQLAKRVIELEEGVGELKEVIRELIRIGELEDITFTDEAATKLFQYWVNKAKQLLNL